MNRKLDRKSLCMLLATAIMEANTVGEVDWIVIYDLEADARERSN